jgi:hypothetical protein
VGGSTFLGSCLSSRKHRENSEKTRFVYCENKVKPDTTCSVRGKQSLTSSQQTEVQRNNFFFVSLIGTKGGYLGRWPHFRPIFPPWNLKRMTAERSKLNVVISVRSGTSNCNELGNFNITAKNLFPFAWSYSSSVLDEHSKTKKTFSPIALRESKALLCLFVEGVLLRRVCAC